MSDFFNKAPEPSEKGYIKPETLALCHITWLQAKTEEFLKSREPANTDEA